MNHEDYMKLALEEAQKAYREDEIPVGTVIVLNDKVIASAHNENRQLNCPTRHAEIIAIEKAAAVLENERLTDCTMYVTKEPCAMCAGAIVHSRINKIFIGAGDVRFGACGTVLNVCGNELLNHIPEIEFGLLGEESSRLLKDFFKSKR